MRRWKGGRLQSMNGQRSKQNISRRQVLPRLEHLNLAPRSGGGDFSKHGHCLRQTLILPTVEPFTHRRTQQAQQQKQRAARSIESVKLGVFRQGLTEFCLQVTPVALVQHHHRCSKAHGCVACRTGPRVEHLVRRDGREKHIFAAVASLEIVRSGFFQQHGTDQWASLEVFHPHEQNLGRFDRQTRREMSHIHLRRQQCIVRIEMGHFAVCGQQHT
mmetsp:Transcript_61952/g.108958  ORF Transcript_61952/g.108958 Transcript_61952/m.108958 type:complete len:216 (+) Transcript_61952:2799-3446(+)